VDDKHPFGFFRVSPGGKFRGRGGAGSVVRRRRAFLLGTDDLAFSL